MTRVDDALQFLIKYLKEPRTPREGQAYGYDLYIPNVCRAFSMQVEGLTIHQHQLEIEQRIPELSAVFYEAAWELCRRGIIRPGVRRHREQVTDDGSGGDGYSLTSRGRSWLAESDTIFIPTETARVAELLGRYRDKFGDGFFQRAQEAVRCYSSTSYLASCVMCGAAAESILLSLAITKTKDEDQVLKTYRSASGRSRITKQILQGLSAQIQTSFNELTALLNYWRDDASHGTASEISEFEAYEAIARLLRFAHFADDHWTDLTK